MGLKLPSPSKDLEQFTSTGDSLFKEKSSKSLQFLKDAVQAVPGQINKLVAGRGVAGLFKETEPLSFKDAMKEANEKLFGSPEKIIDTTLSVGIGSTKNVGKKLKSILGGAAASAAVAAPFLPGKGETYTAEPILKETVEEKPILGNIAQRHNNPGNLVYVGQEGAEKGEEKSPGVYWAKFKDIDSGLKAMSRDNEIKLKRNPDMTLGELINVRSPGDENNSKTLTYNVIDELWDLKKDGTIPSLSSRTKIKDLPMTRVSQALAKAEGFYTQPKQILKNK